MDSSMIQPLSVTPEPQSGESYRGYILRLAEANGLSTPASMFGIAGMHHLQIRLAEHPVEVVAALAGRTPGDFRDIAYSEDGGGSQYNLSGHPCLKTYLRLKSPRICPQCIVETGHIPSLWDLTSVTVCHVHGTRLIDSCGSCGKQLKWLRPGQLTCNCGADLSALRGADAPEALVDLTKVFGAVVRRHHLQDSESKTGMPYSALTAMSLQTLTGIVHALGACRMQIMDNGPEARAGSDPDRECIEAAQVFSDWPNGFDKLLELDSARKSDSPANFVKKHKAIYARLFRMGYPGNEVAFLRQAMLSYSHRHEQHIHIDLRLHKWGKPDDVASAGKSIRNLCKELGIMPSTFRKRVKLGVIKVKAVGAGRLKRYILLENESTGILENPLGELGIRDAARHVGLPVSVLEGLRDRGIYLPKHKTTKHMMWAIPDLNEMVNRLISRCQEHGVQELSQPVALSEVMRMKFRSENIKHEILAAIDDGRLSAFGPAGTAEEIRLSRPEVIRFADKDRKSAGGYYLVREVADLTGFDEDVIRCLVANGVLDGAVVNGTLRIDCDNAEEFRQSYIPLVSLAKEHGTSPRRLFRLCRENGIPVMEAPRKQGPGQPYIQRIHIGLLTEKLAV